MKKTWVLLTTVATVVAITVVSFSLVWAQGDEEKDRPASDFAARIAEILGLDATAVDAAIKQATIELKQKALQDKIDGLVEEGKLTQDQAAEYLEWIQSKPQGLPQIGKPGFKGRTSREGLEHKDPFFGMKGRGDRGHQKRFHGTKKTDRDAVWDWEARAERIKAAVEAGEITQEQADERLEALKKDQDEGLKAEEDLLK